MKERPILFSQANVAAILDGRKTQTRRVVIPSQSTPKVPPVDMEPWLIDGEQEVDNDGIPCWIGYHSDYPTGMKWFSCSQGGVGDRLWVKEALIKQDDLVGYKIDNTPTSILYPWTWQKPVLPGIHMPRWAARIFLEITEIRVERLQDITNRDAVAEGIIYHGDIDEATHFVPSARGAYSVLWDGLNGKTHPWSSNPWVWAISFRRVQ